MLKVAKRIILLALNWGTSMRIHRAVTATLALVFSVTLSGQAVASQWWYVGESSDKSLAFIDVETMVSSPPVHKYWVYYINSATDPTGESVKYRVTVNCVTHTLIILTKVLYARNGTSSSFSDGKAKDIIPDSMGEAESKFVCGSLVVREKLATKLSVTPEAFAGNVREFENTDSTPPK